MKKKITDTDKRAKCELSDVMREPETPNQQSTRMTLTNDARKLEGFWSFLYQKTRMHSLKTGCIVLNNKVKDIDEWARCVNKYFLPTEIILISIIISALLYKHI